MMGIKEVLRQLFINFNRKSSARCAQSETLATRSKFASSGVNNENMSNQQLAKELHKPIIRTFEKRKVYSSFKDKIWVLIWK